MFQHWSGDFPVRLFSSLIVNTGNACLLCHTKKNFHFMAVTAYINMNRMADIVDRQHNIRYIIKLITTDYCSVVYLLQIHPKLLLFHQAPPPTSLFALLTMSSPSLHPPSLPQTTSFLPPRQPLSPPLTSSLRPRRSLTPTASPGQVNPIWQLLHLQWVTVWASTVLQEKTDWVRFR